MKQRKRERECVRIELVRKCAHAPPVRHFCRMRCARACARARMHVRKYTRVYARVPTCRAPGPRVASPHTHTHTHTHRTKNHHDIEGGESIPTMVTLAPSAARHLATAAPMPEEAPVTTTTLPSSLPMPVRLSVRAHTGDRRVKAPTDESQAHPTDRQQAHPTDRHADIMTKA